VLTPFSSSIIPSQKAVTPVKTGVQRLCMVSNKLDSGFRRNDENYTIQTC